MFREWGFLLGEIWVLLLLAALLGLFAGWLIWGRRSSEGSSTLKADLDRVRADLAACQRASADKDREIARLNERLPAKPVAKPVAGPRSAAMSAEPAPAKKKPAKPKKPSGPKKPRTLKQARRGKADDLKLIKGVGPQLEKLCNKLGFYHFDQVAAWTKDEVVWVDENLEGFKGRVSRDKWVKQAKILARGGETEFSRRKKAG